MTDTLNRLLLALNQRSGPAELGAAYDLLWENHRETEAGYLDKTHQWVIRRNGQTPRVELLRRPWQEFRGRRAIDSLPVIARVPRVEYRTVGGPWAVMDWSASLRLVDISPDGFEWGYVGQGPSQLAVALLYEVLSADAALNLWHDFVRAIVSTWDRQGWTLHTLDVWTWADLRPPLSVEQMIEYLPSNGLRLGGAEDGYR